VSERERERERERVRPDDQEQQNFPSLMCFTSSPINHDPVLTSSWAYIRRIDLEKTKEWCQLNSAKCVYILINLTKKEKENTCLLTWTEPVLLKWHITPLKHVESICPIQETILLGQLKRQAPKHGIFRATSCTSCVNAYILGACALLSFLKPSIKHLQITFFFTNWFVGITVQLCNKMQHSVHTSLINHSQGEGKFSPFFSF